MPKPHRAATVQGRSGVSVAVRLFSGMVIYIVFRDATKFPWVSEFVGRAASEERLRNPLHLSTFSCCFTRFCVPVLLLCQKRSVFKSVLWVSSILSCLTVSRALSLSSHAPIVALTGSPPARMLDVNGQCIYFQTATWDGWQLCGPGLGPEPWAQDRKADRTLRLRCQYVCCVLCSCVCVWEGRKRTWTPESSDMWGICRLRSHGGMCRTGPRTGQDFPTVRELVRERQTESQYGQKHEVET